MGLYICGDGMMRWTKHSNIRYSIFYIQYSIHTSPFRHSSSCPSHRISTITRTTTFLSCFGNWVKLKDAIAKTTDILLCIFHHSYSSLLYSTRHYNPLQTTITWDAETHEEINKPSPPHHHTHRQTMKSALHATVLFLSLHHPPLPHPQNKDNKKTLRITRRIDCWISYCVGRYERYEGWRCWTILIVV